MSADSLPDLFSSKKPAGHLRISSYALFITAVALMSGCGTSAEFYENRVQADDVICPPGMSAYHLPGVLPGRPNARKDMVCMSDERMRQTATASKSAGQQDKNPATVAAQLSGEPPAGAIKADVGFPAPGTRWRARFIDAKGVTTTNLHIVVDDETREGKLFHRTNWGIRSSYLYDKETANHAATLRRGKETESYTPHAGTFDWPLYVGKTWKAHYVYRNLVRQTTIDPVQHVFRVEAYEKLVLPAGAWDAFRITSENVNGTSLSTIWYAPDLKLILKRINETTARHSSGITKTIYEIIEFPAKAEAP